MKSLQTCPASWYEQVHNATISIDNSPISVPRHLVVATRINPNAVGERARRLQVRAWNQNQQPDLPGLPLDAGIELVAAHLFGLFSAVGLRHNALAIALSTQARTRNRTYYPARDVRYRVSDAADAELRERAARFANQTESPRFFIETLFGSIEIDISDVVLGLARQLRLSESREEAIELLKVTDERLDHWEHTHRSEEPDERRVTLRAGVEVYLPLEFGRRG